MTISTSRNAPEGGWYRRLQVKLLVMLAVNIVTLPVQVSANLPDHTQADTFVLLREPLVTPNSLGSSALNGLSFADPAAQIVLVDPPKANNTGDAQIVYPLVIPPGRAGVQPKLNLVYNSAGDNGPIGMGWNLSAGEISIDTRWGVPRYDQSEESETYLLDGEVLAPTAVRTDRLPRETDRVFSRRVEGRFDRIRRMGTVPGEYWWEVTDKLGTRYFYGGTPEDQRDPDSILKTDDGNGFSWPLLQIRDKSNNIANFHYEVVAGTGVGSDKSLEVGREIYLTSIEYTGFHLEDGVVCPAELTDCEKPAYRVEFVRDSDPELDEPQRSDVSVDAMGGFLQVTSDLLRKVVVYYGDSVARVYELNYEQGAFAKTLLTSIGQAGEDAQVWATHTFEYFDDARQAPDQYNGFVTQDDAWNTGDDGTGIPIDLGGQFHGFASALGGTSATTVSASAYAGFNPILPAKVPSAGIGMEAGNTFGNSLVEFIDFNGDMLPDKVFQTLSGVQYRLNESGPNGITEFSAAKPATGLALLPFESTISYGTGPELWSVVNVALHGTLGMTIGNSYFIDVNGDLLPDFVNGGLVLFNSKDDDGNSRFTFNSKDTAVPVDPGPIAEALLPDLGEVEEQQRASSPLIDTLRRWKAPWTGVVNISGAVRLLPPDANASPGDGVRVTIQREGDELWSQLIDGGDHQAHLPVGINNVAVNRGDDIYFRVQSRDDGASDRVQWNPTIRYNGVPATTDANGLDVYRYTADGDFTLGGRTGSVAIAPMDGVIRIEGALRKSARTTDDVTMEVWHCASSDPCETTRNASLLASQPVGRNQTGEFPFLAEFDVLGPRGNDDEIKDQILLRLKIDSPVDLSTLSWTPMVYYLSASEQGEPVEVIDAEGNPMLSIHAPVDYQMYPATTLVAPQQTWKSTADRKVTVDPRIVFKLLSKPTGSIAVTVKKKITPADPENPPAMLVAKKILRYVDGDLQNANHKFTFEAKEDTEYWFDLSSPDQALASEWRIGRIRLRWGEGNLIRTLPPVGRRWTYIPEDVFPQAHRGWGLAGYDGNGTRADKPVNESSLIFDPDDYPDEPEAGTAVKPKAFVYFPYVGMDPESSEPIYEWRGSKQNIFGSASEIGSSRSGSDSIGIPGSGGFAGAFGVPRVSIAPGLAFVGGLGGFIEGNAAIAPGFGLLEYMDMNGDQFPDVIGPGMIQYSTPRGGRDLLPSIVCSGAIRRDSTITIGGGLDITLPEVSVDSKGQSNTSRKTSSKSGQKGKSGKGSGSHGAAASSDGSSDVSFGISGSLGGSFTNYTAGTLPGGIDLSEALSQVAIPGFGSGCLDLTGAESDLADINGDGLPDRIRVGWNGTMTVSFNLGYGFSDDYEWPASSFETGLSTFYNAGITAGFSTGALGIGGGVTGSAADTRQRATWVDLNADGLLDQITNFFLDDIKVRFGTGAGLSEAVTWDNFHRYSLKLPFELDVSISDEIAVDTTVGLGAGFDFTYGIGPLCAPVPACYVIVGVGANVEESISRQTIDLQDINGDGYMDHLSSDKGDAITVSLNPTGRTNLLRKISNPIGGSIELEYERKGNTVAQPFSQRVLSAVRVNDGFSWGAECASSDDCQGDGPDSQLTTYEYSESPFDHLERAALGYGIVIERQHDTSITTPDGELPPVIRSWERRYRNSSVFDVGLMESETLLGPDGPFSEIRNIWNLVDIDTGLETDLTLDPTGVAALEMSVHPRLIRTEQEWFENHNSARATSWDFSYDALGNVTRILDVGEPGAEDDMVIRISYSQCTDSSWVNLPDEFEVKLLDGTLLRKRWAEQLCDNNSLTQLSEDTGNGIAVTDLVYDFFGNYADITYPENEQGQRYRVVYEYDAPRWTNVANVTDSFGLGGSATYHGATGQLASRTDSNGQSTHLSFDSQGRKETLTSPYEQGTANATVEFDYHPQTAQYSWARARHFDVSNPTDTVDTIQFIDGMARQTQTKQDASVFDESSGASTDVMVVSGAKKFDAIGRIAAEWHPSTEPIGKPGVFKLEPDTITPTVVAWTFFEELQHVIEPHGAVTTWHYSFRKPIAEAGKMLVAERVDALGKTTRTFTNMAGFVEFSERDYNDAGSTIVLQTAVLWDSLDQFIGLVDPAGNETTHTLDLLGRRIGSETPDGGLVTYEFDTASQLIRKTTPEIRAIGAEISYSYDHNRLIGINYPDDTPDVSYQFGASGAPDNGIGRIVQLDDGTRIQQLKYGKMGERIEETTTVRTHNYSEQKTTGKKPFGKNTRDSVWTTRWIYDSWGRLMNLVYPDGESVVYEYDTGGLVKTVTGDKAGHQYRYVDEQFYDEFAMRRYQRTGNGVETITRYEADSRRLKVHITNAPARDVQDITYEYDLGGNILSIDNAAPEPRPNLMGGRSHHDYQYDDLHRLVYATGSYDFNANKRREYTYALDYDLLGNIERKSQQDFVGKGKKLNPVHESTYLLDYVYGSTPHQASQVGDRSYSYDMNGNSTGWDDNGNSKRRSLQWDAENRVSLIQEQGSTTEYRYNDASELTVARGPGGETIFVNKFYTVRNSTVAWKHIWVGSEQISTKREKSGRVFEHEQFLLHKDLRGNIRIVTDTVGKIYEYLEYFPGGESWVLEHSNTDRVPYRFIGGYFDEDRETYNLGYRWYDPRDQVFLSQDPVLQDSPADAIFNPDLLAAYTYGDNNPLRLLDHDGRAPSNAFIHHLQKRYLGEDETFTPQEVSRIRSAVVKNSAFADEFLSKPTTLKGRLGSYIADQRTQRVLIAAKWQLPPVIKIKFRSDGSLRSIRVFNKTKKFKPKRKAKK